VVANNIFVLVGMVWEGGRGWAERRMMLKMVTGTDVGSTVSEVEEKPFTSSLNICPEARDGIFKSFRSPEIDSEESIPPANVST
jgi:hypothetical protein